MSKALWFLIGWALGDLWSGWLMHVVYIGVIAALLWTGHHPFACK